MVALFDDPSFVQYIDAVCVPEGADAMGNQDRRLARAHLA